MLFPWLRAHLRARTYTLAALAFAAIALSSPRAHALAVGGHVGLNLDRGDVHLGADVLVPLTELSPSLQLALWPSFAHVFSFKHHDVELFGLDMPFVFRVGSAPILPFVGPGLGLAIYGDVSVKFNVIGGAFFDTGGPIRPFGEMAVRFVNGTFVDLLFGVVVEL
jgi:hypothetical protein